MLHNLYVQKESVWVCTAILTLCYFWQIISYFHKSAVVNRVLVLMSHMIRIWIRKKVKKFGSGAIRSLTLFSQVFTYQIRPLFVLAYIAVLHAAGYCSTTKLKNNTRGCDAPFCKLKSIARIKTFHSFAFTKKKCCSAIFSKSCQKLAAKWKRTFRFQVPHTLIPPFKKK